MTSARTVKTLAYLMAAMTAVTLVLSLVEPWTVSLRPQPASARAEQMGAGPATLASVAPATWTQPVHRLELVLAAQDGNELASLPAAHMVVQADGRVDVTDLWRQCQPLPNQVLRICAVYSGQPSDVLLQRWLKICDDAGRQANMQAKRIQLSTTAQTSRNPAQAKMLRELQRRLSMMLRNQPAT